MRRRRRQRRLLVPQATARNAGEERRGSARVGCDSGRGEAAMQKGPGQGRSLRDCCCCSNQYTHARQRTSARPPLCVRVFCPGVTDEVTTSRGRAGRKGHAGYYCMRGCKASLSALSRSVQRTLCALYSAKDASTPGKNVYASGQHLDPVLGGREGDSSEYSVVKALCG